MAVPNDAENTDFPEDVELADEEAMGADKVKQIREKLKKCEVEKQEYLDGWQRARADLVNARKQDEVAKQEFATYAKEAVIADILPTLESFELAMSDKESWSKLPENWTKGIEYIHTQLLQALKQNGLEEINPIGQKFDPTKHEAIDEEPATDMKEDGTVASVKQRGFVLHDKVIRPAKVVLKTYSDSK